MTAWFAVTQVAATPPARVADLGCGIGAVLMLLAWSFPAARVVGVEAQAISVALARRSLAWNGAADRCEVRLGDLRDPHVLSEAGTFDLVTGTPPYLRPGTATESRRVQCAPCHFEHRGGIEVYCLAAARLLAPAGRFVVCHAADARVTRAAAAAGLAITARRDVIPRQGKAALFAVYTMERAGRRVDGVDQPPLVVRDRTGARTAAFAALRREMGMPP
jgi:tRNA1(Val) A37 N6-methylase TrmN6